MKRYIVSYDIGGDRARRRVARLLMRRGRRLQESVFEVLAHQNQLVRLLQLVKPLLTSTDSVMAFTTTGEAQVVGPSHVALTQPRVSVL